MLNLSKLKKEINILESRLKLSGQNLDRLLNDQCVQQFVLTYEICMQFIIKYLEESSGSPSEIEHLDSEQIIRKAYRVSIISEELEVWKQFINLRDKINSNSLQATDTTKMISHFLGEARYLFKQLQERVKYLE